ncbi:MAG: mobile mystery protein B [Kordiimonadaceae bacterium]|nr:mobile mystery protein B [Kordiimonadaceae bacterium]
MPDLFVEADGASQLDPDEQAGLRPTWITTRGELNQAEADNIAAAVAWSQQKTRQRNDLLTPNYVLNLHKRMFNDVWRWAGGYRRTAKNIGVDANRISAELMQRLSDVRYWVENETMPKDEIAVRFHHQLVFVHPFPNGNGRHSRLMADMLCAQLGRPLFTWGGSSLLEDSEVRARYIATLKLADAYNISPLLEFARS